MVYEIQNPRKGYRSRLEIVKDILNLLDDTGKLGTKKTHIMYGANLSYRLLTRYMDDILTAGLAEYYEESSYRITSKGKRFLNFYEEYEDERREIEKHVVTLNNGREELEKMLEC